MKKFWLMPPYMNKYKNLECMMKSFLFAAALLFSLAVASQTPNTDCFSLRCDMPSVVSADENPGKLLPPPFCDDRHNGKGNRPHFTKEQIQTFHEQARQRKRLYFIGKMELNEVDKTIFLELFDKYEDAIHRSRNTDRDARMSVTDGFTDEQYLEVIKIITNESMKQAQARQSFIESLQKTLNPEQVYKFFKAEGEFNRQLVRDFDDNCKKERK